MDTFQEHNPEEASQAEPTIKEIKEWDEYELLKWIQQKQPKLLRGDNLEKFEAAFINGGVFLKRAGDVEFFNRCNLPMGISDRLADLAKQIVERETAGMKRNRQQAENVDKFDSAGKREQIESAQPPPKRRRLNAIPPSLVALAEKAREQRDYLQKQYPDQEMLRQQLSNPALVTRLPFPFPGEGKPTERFTILDGKWSYMGREYFTTLLDEVTRSMKSETRELSLYGTIGYGKSHLLAALACYLTVDGTRVVYVPDCREWCKGPFTYFQAAMLFTWANDTEMQEDIKNLESMEDIDLFFRSQPAKLLFIYDQMNALDLEDEKYDTVSNLMKQELRKWMNAFAQSHKVIYSASANYKARTEMQQWWIWNNNALPDEYKADDLDEDTAGDLKTFKSEAQDITGCIPLLLDKCIVKGKIDLAAPRLGQVFTQVQQFMFNIYKRDNAFWGTHCEHVTACITNERPPEYLPLEYVDHRYFFVEDKKGQYACGIAREAAARQLREYKMTEFANLDSRNVLVEHIRNPSVTGFFIGQAVLSSIVAHGLAVMNINQHVRQEMFVGDYPTFDKSLENWVLYCPMQFNYPAIDAILVRFGNLPGEDNSSKKTTSRKKANPPKKTNSDGKDDSGEKNNSDGKDDSGEKNNSDGKDDSGEKKKCYLYPIQVTVAKSHADSVERFFNHLGDWTQGLEDYDIQIEFCWITADKELKFQPLPLSSRSLRSRDIIKPAYKLTHIPLREVSKEIWKKYRRAKESQG